MDTGTSGFAIYVRSLMRKKREVEDSAFYEDSIHSQINATFTRTQSVAKNATPGKCLQKMPVRLR